jgi:hypothetical protein
MVSEVHSGSGRTYFTVERSRGDKKAGIGCVETTKLGFAEEHSREWELKSPASHVVSTSTGGGSAAD